MYYKEELKVGEIDIIIFIRCGGFVLCMRGSGGRRLKEMR
jgi:hypothetical protein